MSFSNDSDAHLDGEFEPLEGPYYTLRFERHFAHSPTRIWSSISDPEGTKLWLNQVDTLELRVGGAFLIRTYDESDPAAWTSGVVTEVDEPRVLAYTWNQGPYAGGPAVQSRVRFELEPEGEGAALKLSHVLYEPAALVYVSTFLSAWQFHLDALHLNLDGAYESFAEYVSQLLSESGLEHRDFFVQHVGAMREGYRKKFGL